MGKSYIKLYHYSDKADLSYIDPAYYGTGVSQFSECKQGKKGVNKSFFYYENKPESCVRAPFLYEVYLPLSWRYLVYDISMDKHCFYKHAEQGLSKELGRMPYRHETVTRFEKLLKKAGYKGYYNPRHPQIPHALILFNKLSTNYPSGQFSLHCWSNLKNKRAYNPALFQSEDAKRLADNNRPDDTPSPPTTQSIKPFG